MGISAVVLLVLVVGILSQLVFQFLNRDRTSSRTGLWIAFFNASLALSSLVLNETRLLPTSGPPPKFDLLLETDVSLASVRECLATAAFVHQATTTVVPHTSGGYSVEIVGREMMFSAPNSGLWERVGFFIDLEEFDDRLRVQFVGLQGQSTHSNSDLLPPAGDRWEPFNAQEMAYFSDRIDGMFWSLADCIETRNH